MFVLQEVDKILENLSKLLNRKRDAGKLRLSLADIERVKVDKNQLAARVSFNYERNFHLALPDFRFTTSSYERLMTLRETLLGEKYQTTDSLVFTLMASSVLSKLALSPEYHYPSAKLIICDSNSYDLLCRLKRISISREITNEFGTRINLRNFLYKNPFNITAIMLMQNIVDMFASTNQPVIIKSRELLSRNVVANFNYPLLRRVFPYIKMSELFIVVDNRNNTYNLNYFSLGTATPEQTLLQLLSRYAKSTKLVDLSYVINSIGKPHQIHKNVLMFDTTLAPNKTNKANKPNDSPRILFNRIELTSMTYLAERLLQVSRRLRLKLNSISHRKENDPDQTKIFAQFIASAVSSPSQPSKTNGDNFNKARVLVLDRSRYIQSPFQHADRYGPFFEQEGGKARSEMLRLDTINKLDEIVYLDKLTEVLATILSYSQGLKSTSSSLRPTSPRDDAFRVDKSHSQALTTSSSIKKHLELIKEVYRRLNEGYLIILKLEANLDSIDKRLANSKMEVDEQTSLVEQLQKIRDGLRQLIKTSGSSILPSDLLRLALLIIDVLNKLHSKCLKLNQKASLQVVADLKQSILADADLKKALKATDSESGGIPTLSKMFSRFDKLSEETSAASFVNPTIEETIKQFIDSKREDDDLFRTINLDKEIQKQEDDVVIVMFLGSMTAHEVAQVKLLERSFNNLNIILLNCGIAEPEVFLSSL